MSFQHPEVVAFKRSSDNKYLCATSVGGLTYLQFTATDLSDRNAAFEMIYVNNGYVVIRSLATGLFWERSSTSNWIFASGKLGHTCDPFSNPNMLFLPVKLDENNVAYRNKANQLFCKSRSVDGKRECLIASAPDLSDVASMELVLIPGALP